ncbi:MAG: glyoxalase/bleomycin resistance protein/dioxygenase [Parcubacteria group bacterium Gr01-1014_49]|nr:MAG: glyoxalase/bleomycin resistance protein/dioxygenase [Parcubacteria group bacterium Gr01-1014_49]
MQIQELGHVVLYVTDLARMADFYEKTLGFHQIAREWPVALFSGGRTHHELLLIEVGGAPRPAGRAHEMRPGLYHIGFKIGDGPDAAKKVHTELKEKGVTIIGMTDHTVTHSIYILDPDGNELELYADVSTDWKKDPNAILAAPKPLRL